MKSRVVDYNLLYQCLNKYTYLIILLDNAPVEWKIVGKIQAKSGKHTGGSFFIQVGNQLEYS